VCVARECAVYSVRSGDAPEFAWWEGYEDWGADEVQRDALWRKLWKEEVMWMRSSSVGRLRRCLSIWLRVIAGTAETVLGKRYGKTGALRRCEDEYSRFFTVLGQTRS